MNNLSKMITGLVIAATIVSTGAVAMAADANTASGTNTQGSKQATVKMMRGEGRHKGDFGKGEVKGNMENNLKALVSAGTITQDEADKILALSKQQEEARAAEKDKLKNMTDEERKAYFDSMKGQADKKKGDIFAQAVLNGILTQEKADEAKAKLQETHQAEEKAALADGLKGLVTAGTITQAQADKVSAYIDILKANKPAPGTETPDQKKEKKNPLSALVDDGTLAQAQLDEVSKVIGKGHGQVRHKGQGLGKPAKDAAGTTSTDSNI